MLTPWNTRAAAVRARRFRYLWLAALLVLLPTGSSAQQRIATESEAASTTGGPPQVRIYVGMWTLHLRDLGRGLQPNWALGVAWRGLVGGTFINSYGDRAFLVGHQRTVARGGSGPVVPTFGYRLGLLTGYDERFLPIASKLPVIPMGQLRGSLEGGRAGVELAWAGLVSSLGPSVGF